MHVGAEYQNLTGLSIIEYFRQQRVGLVTVLPLGTGHVYAHMFGYVSRHAYVHVYRGAYRHVGYSRVYKHVYKHVDMHAEHIYTDL